MLQLDASQAKRILVTELGYSSLGADMFLRDFPPIHEELAEAVSRWMADRTVLDVEVAGLTLTELMRVRRAHFLMAVRLLNRLLDSDVDPDNRVRLARILHRPLIRW